MEYPQYYLLIARWGGGGQLNTFLLTYYSTRIGIPITFVLQYKKDWNTYNLRITVQEGMEYL